ncbi:MAG: putative Ig domain-containing protein [Planctomycetaceae bacterium]|nr:putative Ig domain-containing protein [Planctomycetaceae bacterium]
MKRNGWTILLTIGVLVIAGTAFCAAPSEVEVVEEEVILTPLPGPQPRLNNPTVFGARPGNPFVYRLPATGTRPMTFEAQGLPESLTLDAATGIITGNSPRQRGEYPIVFKARNASGQAEKQFKLVVGDTLALTPPMGWNSWYIHLYYVTDAHMRQAADILVSSGMADHGYMYVNIDDSWSKAEGQEPYRNACGRILPNEKFPDMKALTDYIHGKGLRAGIYSSPGPLTCGKFAASFGHEQLDAQQFAEWGFDFLKYDRCSYRLIENGESVYEYRKPFAMMGAILQNVNRDIVYNLCQYGLGDVWEWGAQVGGNTWRTERDLRAASFLRTGLRNAAHAQFAGPGHWNDPDYILIGWLGHRPAREQGPTTPTPLTPNQRYQHMSLWALSAAPLFFSCDLTQLDAFTLNVLCNAEIIAVDQDELGVQGRVVTETDDYFVMVKPLADGSKAVGLFNKTKSRQTIRVSSQELQVAGKQSLRDLWRQKDIGLFEEAYETTLERLGVTVLRLSSAEKNH